MPKRSFRAARPFCTATRLTSISLSLLLSMMTLTAAMADDMSADDLNKLKATEQKLFVRTYDDDSSEARVGRIEKRMFGEAESGDLHGRLAKIVEIAKPFEHKEPPKAARTAAPAKATNQKQNAEDEKLRQEDAREQARLRAVAAKEDEVNQLFAEAVSLYKAHRGPEAMDKFEQVVRLAPDNAEAHFSLGVGYEAQHKYKEALSNYSRAAALNPSKREYKEAVVALQKSAHSDESEDPDRQLAGEAAKAYSQGEYMSALNLYKELDGKKPRQAKVKYNIGTIYLALKNPVQALEYFQEAYKLKPDEPKFKEACDKLKASLGQAAAEHQTSGHQQSADQWSHPGKTQINFSNQENGSNSQGKTPPPATAYGLILKRHKEGIEINTVGIGSRAASCGLQHGDIIKAIDGAVVNSIDDVNSILASKSNSRVQLLIQRGTKIGQVVF